MDGEEGRIWRVRDRKGRKEEGVRMGRMRAIEGKG